MRTQFIRLGLATILVCPLASAQWVQTSLGLPDSSRVHCFAVSGTNLLAGTVGGGGVFLSTDNGSSWSAVNEGLARRWFDSTRVVDIFCLESTGDSLFAGTDSDTGHVFRSTNNGSKWTAVTGLDSGITYGGFIGKVTALAVSDTNLFAGIDKYNARTLPHSLDYIYRSIDGSTSWMMCAAWPDFSISSLAVSATNIYAGGGGGYPGYGGVFRSTDNGTNWTAARTGLLNTGVFAFAVSGSNLFAGTDSGVFLTTNNGTSWTAVNKGLPKDTYDTTLYAAVNGLALSGQNLFAGTYRGVILSMDNGTTWDKVNLGLTDTTVYCLALDATYLFAGTQTGVWRRPLSEMITFVGLPLAELPTRFSLKQNYPNPFNPSTTIRYELPQSAVVRLSVFDLLGRGVSVLVDERRDAGVHEVQFDASGLASGVYFYRLQAGDFTQTKRLLLLK